MFHLVWSINEFMHELYLTHWFNTKRFICYNSTVIYYLFISYVRPCLIEHFLNWNDDHLWGKDYKESHNIKSSFYIIIKTKRKAPETCLCNFLRALLMLKKQTSEPLACPVETPNRPSNKVNTRFIYFLDSAVWHAVNVVSALC